MTLGHPSCKKTKEGLLHLRWKTPILRITPQNVGSGFQATLSSLRVSGMSRRRKMGQAKPKM